MALSLLPLSQLDALYLLHSVATLLPLTFHSYATLLGLRSYTTLMYSLSHRQYKYPLMEIRDPHLVFASRTYTRPLSPQLTPLSLLAAHHSSL